MNEDAGVGGVIDGGVGGEAGGEGAGLKPPVPEREFHDGVSDVQVSGRFVSFFFFFAVVGWVICVFVVCIDRAKKGLTNERTSVSARLKAEMLLKAMV